MPKGTKFDLDEKSIRARYLRGDAVKDIAADAGVRRAIIQYRLNKMMSCDALLIEERKRRLGGLPTEQREAARALRKKGWMVPDIAEYLGVHLHKVEAAVVGLSPPRTVRPSDLCQAEQTQSFIRSVIEYDPDSGVFTWRERDRSSHWNRAWNSKYAGKAAGKIISKPGYDRIQINILGKRWMASRLAWFFVHGSLPEYIDHINGNPLDNRLCNLRPVTAAQNAWNSKVPKDNKSGVKGVCFVSKTRKWRACIQAHKKSYVLGEFDNFEDAVAARLEAQHRLHGEYARVS